MHVRAFATAILLTLGFGTPASAAQIWQVKFDAIYNEGHYINAQTPTTGTVHLIFDQFAYRDVYEPTPTPGDFYWSPSYPSTIGMTATWNDQVWRTTIPIDLQIVDPVHQGQGIAGRILYMWSSGMYANDNGYILYLAHEELLIYTPSGAARPNDTALFGGYGDTYFSPHILNVPEPAEWVMMMMGFAGIGGYARLRRQNNATLQHQSAQPLRPHGPS